jgi:hypothetical protein
MKTNFIRKPTTDELIPHDEFVIEKTIVLDKDLFDRFILDPLHDQDFIKDNLDLMYCDKENVFHCIFVTSEEHDFGILVESEGYQYARYAAYLPKAAINK